MKVSPALCFSCFLFNFNTSHLLMHATFTTGHPFGIDLDLTGLLLEPQGNGRGHHNGDLCIPQDQTMPIGCLCVMAYLSDCNSKIAIGRNARGTKDVKVLFHLLKGRLGSDRQSRLIPATKPPEVTYCI